MYNMDRPLVSVIIPVYNAEQYLDECIKSVISQSYDKLEIILVNDGSIDNSPNMCDNWALKDHRIRVVHKTNGGLSDARNAGLDIATGSLISFVDSDDFIDKKMYEELIFVLRQNNACIVSCESVFFINGEEKIIPHYHKRDELSILTSEIFLGELLSLTFDCSVCNKLFDYKLIGEHRFEKGKYNEDILFMFEIMKGRQNVVHINKGYYKYRVTEGSITHTFNKRSLDQMYNAFKLLKISKDTYPVLVTKARRYAILVSKDIITKIKESNLQGCDVYSSASIDAKRFIINNIPFLLFSTSFNYKERLRVLKRVLF